MDKRDLLFFSLFSVGFLGQVFCFCFILFVEKNTFFNFVNQVEYRWFVLRCGKILFITWAYFFLMVEIRFFANFREVVGKDKIEVKSKDIDDVRDVIEILVEKYPELEEMFFDGSELREYVNLILNDQKLEQLSGLDTEVNSRDSLVIFPPVSGG
ncbi:MAG: Molybdopterin converting factor small subunit MoaD [Candidatus Methanohalarchaeum thermophilum]|uniref:Molybdopterin converting factor small subunit MoaD n=1 Tax=Methanohalarchaeum thermophilum TaxID=1903181 RepID=A0A1Q6DW96_METT1|nr:MAG: Molybdopterin converting factor small subunit MoaD [Candidatus Methanohalarchaeum thermophilum]